MGEFTKNTGKKPLDVKQKDVLTYLFQEKKVQATFQNDDFLKKVKSNLKFSQVAGALLKAASHSESCDEFIDWFLAVIEEDISNEVEDAGTTESVISNAFGQRLVKKFIHSFDKLESERKSLLEEKIADLVTILLGNLNKIMKSRAVFVIIALIESTSYSQKVL